MTGHERLKVIDDHLLQRFRIERLRERFAQAHQDFEFAGAILQQQRRLAQCPEFSAARPFVGAPGADEGDCRERNQHDGGAGGGGEVRWRRGDDRLLQRAPEERHAGNRCRNGDPEPHRQACARAAGRRFVALI